MDNVNKIISFVLGLIVVIIVLLLVTGRLGVFKGGQFFAARGSTTTPTPTKSATVTNKNVKVTPTPRRLAQNIVSVTPAQSGEIKTIPSTGTPTGILFLSGVVFVGGLYLRKVSS